MPFKVVQTLEGNRFKLFTVPSGWETENILRYPCKYIKKYIMDENSTPLPDWEVIKCKVKRSNIPTYNAADRIISEMLKHSDTEEDVTNIQRGRPQNKKSLLDLNAKAQKMVGNVLLRNNTDITSSPANMLNELNYNITYIEEPQAISTQTSEVSLENITPLVQETVTIDINKIFENQKLILDRLENQATILSLISQNQQQQQESNTAIITQIQSVNNVQNGLIQKVSALSVQLEDAVSQIISSPRQDDVLTLNKSQSRIENIPVHVKPVDSIQDLEELEKQLSDVNNRAHLKNTLSILCSGGKALDCAYLLVDVMFTRKFLFECSWSGASRGENLKVPLKGYKHVLSFFWQMVHSWNDAYTLQDNEVFFKTILKNAKKRKMAKHDRASTSRQSSKRMKFYPENVPTENEAFNAHERENETNEEKNTEENKEIGESEEHREINKENINTNRLEDIGNWNRNIECYYEEEEEEESLC